MRPSDVILLSDEETLATAVLASTIYINVVYLQWLKIHELICVKYWTIINVSCYALFDFILLKLSLSIEIMYFRAEKCLLENLNSFFFMRQKKVLTLTKI